MLSAARQQPAARPRARVIALPRRPPPRPLPGGGEPAVRATATAASLLLHAAFLAVCAWQVVVSPADPPPIRVTLLGVPDAGGSPPAAPSMPACPVRRGGGVQPSATSRRASGCSRT
jgi:hypothetical protein